MGQKLESVPLCVDLDGTLLKTDLLFESFCQVIKQKPWAVLVVLLALLRGRAAFKRALASRIELDPEGLPYNQPFLEFLVTEHQTGRRLILATASDHGLADKISEHLNIFEDVVGSDGSRNLKGAVKRDLLIERFGERGFDYAGDSPSDLKIWSVARKAILVGPAKKFSNRVSSDCEIERDFVGSEPSLKKVVKALRVHQWVKNILIFVPAVMAHRIFDLQVVTSAVSAFLAFSLIASAVYLINDLMDLPSDRRHASKCKRPFASGDLPLIYGFFLVPILLLAGLNLACLLPSGFLPILCCYFVITLSYSLVLKQKLVLDVIILASLYTIRILAGGAAIPVTVSTWLLVFSMFFFLSLACAKRFSELYILRAAEGEAIVGRGYRATDLEQIARSGTSSGYISVLVLALYITSADIAVLYGHSDLLWGLGVVILYWVSRIWVIANRGELDEDPILFAIHDRVSYLVGLIALIVILLAL